MSAYKDLVIEHSRDRFVLDRDAVVWIDPLPDIVDLPGSNPGLLGAYLYRGRFFPVVRLERLLCAGEAQPTEQEGRGPLLLICSGERMAGVLVEQAPVPAVAGQAGIDVQRLSPADMVEQVEALVIGKEVAGE